MERSKSYLDSIPLDQRLKLLVTEWPDLHVHGLRTAIVLDRELLSWRRELMKAHDEVTLCMEMLASAPRICRPQISSYWLKHAFERVLEKKEQPCYIPNGVLIAAALLVGIKVKPIPPNGLLAVGRRWGRNLTLED
jgi:hypothetical protein